MRVPSMSKMTPLGERGRGSWALDSLSFLFGWKRLASPSSGTELQSGEMVRGRVCRENVDNLFSAQLLLRLHWFNEDGWKATMVELQVIARAIGDNLMVLCLRC